MAHELSAVLDSTRGVVFRCAVCAREIEFVKVGFGAPNPVWDGAQWLLPENPDQWMPPCSQN